MTFPAFLFGLLIASLIGILYHLVRGDRPSRLAYYLLLAWTGFALGQVVGGWFGWSFLRLGPLNAGASAIGCLIFLAVGDWLSRIEPTA